MKKTLLLWLCLAIYVQEVEAQDNTLVVFGQVVQMNQEPLPGATVAVKGDHSGVVTDDEGKFTFRVDRQKITLLISFIGFEPVEIELDLPLVSGITVSLQEADSYLQEVEVVSTGYESLPKERATGAFVFQDEEILNRRISNNIIDRLEDITPGLIFNRAGGGQDPISIRGRSTIHANTQPLIIIDNFPYDGPLENINPNDVASITILKDAAAASIWGARAGNGVIVITTKKGGYNQALKVSLNSNVTVMDKPNLFYLPQMTPAEYIEMEQILFGRGHYNNLENALNRAPLTPVVEALIGHRDGLISEGELDSQLRALGRQDVRNDFSKHLYQRSIQQQYALNIRGGGASHTYSFAGGYDKDRASLVGNQNERYTIQGQNTWSLLKNRLQLSSGLYLVRQNSMISNEGPDGITFQSAFQTYPYARIADEYGNPLQLTRDYRRSFVDGAIENGLQDWSYFPLRELDYSTTSSRGTDIRLNTGISYKITEFLSADVMYQYWQNETGREQLHERESYYSRNLINQFAQRQGAELQFAVPIGDIFINGRQFSHSHNLRAQLKYQQTFANIHDLTIFGGYEIKDHHVVGNQNRFYGYNPNLAISQPVDMITSFPQYHNPGLLSTVPSGISHIELTDRFISYFANGAYSYKNKYILSGSIRKDQSNLFGVAANQRGVPLWSVGGSWIISREQGFNWGAVSLLKLRGTFGYNGNIDKTLTSEVTSLALTGFAFSLNPGLPYSRIQNPPNPDLRWERIKIWNGGLDFEMKGGRLWGTVDYFYKEGLDLLGDTPLAPSAGLLQFRGNSANTVTKGIDLILNTHNLQGQFDWKTSLLFNQNREEVKQYFFNASANEYLIRGGGVAGWPVPWEGRPLFAIYSYPWAGLDPDTGNPRGFLDGEPSSNYANVVNSTSLDDLNYHGPARPTIFGAVRNDFQYKNFALSVNVSYRMGYYFRRNSVLYNPILSAQVGHGDFTRRWQNPGDELITNVPSLPLTQNVHRDNLYRFSEVNVERGDHIRLQDIRLSYLLSKSQFPDLPFDRVEFYTYANNLGILWKHSNDPLDPDFQNGIPPLRSLAVGFRIDF